MAAYEDSIAKQCEELILKFNPSWTGKNEIMHPIQIPKEYDEYFSPVWHEQFKINIDLPKKVGQAGLKRAEE